ncbi:MAG TPA: hypothetical protein VK116_07550, partial [Planctomycetota bacterium]|nr:hypothetical protein [Planctomycetota bacterium]
EGCCSESCADIADPQQSPGACRVFDVHLNGEIVLDQYSQNVHASHVSGRLPGVDSNLIGVTNLFYAADVTEIEVIIDDLGAGNPPENASIKGIAIRKLTDDEAAQVGAPCGGATGPIFLRGDADASGALNLTDAIRILTFLFVGNVEVSCLDAADSDDSGALNLTDGIFVLNYLFVGLSPAPPPPFPECGPDPTDDSTACEVSQPNCSQ